LLYNHAVACFEANAYAAGQELVPFLSLEQLAVPVSMRHSAHLAIFLGGVGAAVAAVNHPEHVIVVQRDSSFSILRRNTEILSWRMISREGSRSPGP